MSEMVERVARAICQNVHGGNDPCAEDYQAARAAIEAMREPTEAMKLAGEVPLINSGPQDDAWSLSSAAYRSMIEAALASERKP